MFMPFIIYCLNGSEYIQHTQVWHTVHLCSPCNFPRFTTFCQLSITHTKISMQTTFARNPLISAKMGFSKWGSKDIQLFMVKRNKKSQLEDDNMLVSDIADYPHVTLVGFKSQWFQWLFYLFNTISKDYICIWLHCNSLQTFWTLSPVSKLLDCQDKYLCM